MKQIGSKIGSLSLFKVATASSFCVMVTEYFVVSLTVPLNLSFAFNGSSKESDLYDPGNKFVCLRQMKEDQK